MKVGSVAIAFLFILHLTSCVKYKKLVYLQSDKDSLTIKQISYKRSAYKIKPGDNLDIKFSSMDEKTSTLFNKEMGPFSTSQVNAASLYIQSYVVNDSGFIHHPVLGSVKASGLTIQELTEVVSRHAGDMLILKNVDIKITNFRVSILGEVANPGTQLIYSDNLTLFQALSLAGDLTDFGNRKKIKIIRNNDPKTSATIAYLDITRPECITSEFYYLMPNDVIYVMPVKYKAVKANLPLYQAALASFTAIYIVFKLINIK